jgi:hypothetical protein
MYQAKTKENDLDISQFIERIENEKRREDARKLLTLFSETTGLAARMWGDSIIGFGSYHYKYDSGHEGDAAITGFSPRKAKISLYLTTGPEDRVALLAKLGKHTAGVGCVYINKLADIDEDVLKELILKNLSFIRETYPSGVS